MADFRFPGRCGHTVPTLPLATLSLFAVAWGGSVGLDGYGTASVCGAGLARQDASRRARLPGLITCIGCCGVPGWYDVGGFESVAGAMRYRRR